MDKTLEGIHSSLTEAEEGTIELEGRRVEIRTEYRKHCREMGTASEASGTAVCAPAAPLQGSQEEKEGKDPRKDVKTDS